MEARARQAGGGAQQQLPFVALSPAVLSLPPSLCLQPPSLPPTATAFPRLSPSLFQCEHQTNSKGGGKQRSGQGQLDSRRGRPNLTADNVGASRRPQLCTHSPPHPPSPFIPSSPHPL